MRLSILVSVLYECDLRLMSNGLWSVDLTREALIFSSKILNFMGTLVWSVAFSYSFSMIWMDFYRLVFLICSFFEWFIAYFMSLYNFFVSTSCCFFLSLVCWLILILLSIIYCKAYFLFCSSDDWCSLDNCMRWLMRMLFLYLSKFSLICL